MAPYLPVPQVLVAIYNHFNVGTFIVDAFLEPFLDNLFQRNSIADHRSRIDPAVGQHLNGLWELTTVVHNTDEFSFIEYQVIEFQTDRLFKDADLDDPALLAGCLDCHGDCSRLPRRFELRRHGAERHRGRRHLPDSCGSPPRPRRTDRAGRRR